MTASFTLPKVKTIDDFLANPFDLQKFKKVRGQSNSGGVSKKTYFLKPDVVGMYYGFFMFKCSCGYIGQIPNTNIHMENGLEIITYKPLGKYRDSYIDPTETLIQVFARFNDKDLPELAFIGLDTTIIKQKLGDKFLRKDNCFIYTKNQNALTLKIKGKTIEWLKYTRLNMSLTTFNIPSGLLNDKN